MTPQRVSAAAGLIDKAQAAIPSSEDAVLARDEWLRLAAQGSQLGLWFWNEATQTLFWDTKTRQMFGVNLEGDVTLETFYEALHPDDLGRVQEVWRYELESALPYELEYRALRPDGTIRWISARGSGFYDEAGKPLYMIGVVFDVTERKEAEQERLELSARLINAQDQERIRLAQEIHDDFCQRLALHSIELQTVARMIQGTDACQRVNQSIGTLTEITNDIQSLSRRLYSSNLDLLGLVPAIRSLCAEFAKQREIQITCDLADIPDKMVSDASLSLYRIVQEALHNVSKHSCASNVEVHLSVESDVTLLTITDNGKGFDLTGLSSSSGIGVQSMRARTLVLGGEFEIQSRPAIEGTRIAVKVPSR